jgi:glucan phosphoethanolaminetransferase (alkaline phosphatase superfamily)
MRKIRAIIALVLMILINWVGYWYIYERADHLDPLKQRSLKYVLYFLWLGVICIVGYWSMKGFQIKWIQKIWIILYAIIIILLLMAGVIDHWIGITSADVRDLISVIKAFFQSPMPFVVCWFLATRFGKKQM